MSRIYKNIRAVFLFFLIFMPVVFANLLQIISLVIRPFSRARFRQFNCWLAGLYWGYLVYLNRKVNRVEVSFSGDTLPAQENALLIVNHQTISDIPALLFLGQRYGRLSDMKWFVKDIVKYVPGPGWGMLFLDCVFLKRNWLSDRPRIEATFCNIVSHNVSCWLVSFLEGTRLTPEKKKKSDSRAIRRGLTPPRHVMIPRTKGFVATVTGLQDHLGAVYNVTIDYPGETRGIWQMLRGDLKGIAIDVERTPVKELPQSEKELTEWAINAYYLKDMKLSAFRKNGRFRGKEA